MADVVLTITCRRKKVGDKYVTCVSGDINFEKYVPNSGIQHQIYTLIAQGVNKVDEHA